MRPQRTSSAAGVAASVGRLAIVGVILLFVDATNAAVPVPAALNRAAAMANTVLKSVPSLLDVLGLEVIE